MSSTNTNSSVKSDTVNYLLLYEAMVRHQDLEFDATSDHIKSIVDRIETLGKPAPQQREEKVPRGMITYRQMRRCLLRLGYTWNRYDATNSLNNNSAAVDNYYDDNVSVISATSVSSRVSGGTSSGSAGFGNVRDIIATDAQLIMLLTTLVEMEERYHYEEGKSDNVFPRGLFVAEFVQAYKLIIGGMQSLQTFPRKEDSGGSGLLQDLRVRSRERTLGLIRLFGPDASLYSQTKDSSSYQQSAGESPAGKSRRRNQDGLTLTPNRSPKRPSSKDPKKPKDGLLPRLSDAEIRKMVHSKDSALAKILENHEEEMNIMADKMKSLELEKARTLSVLKKRKRRAQAVTVFLVFMIFVFGGWFEYNRQQKIKEDIASGREAERKAEEELIGKLKDEIQLLSSKLGDAEAAIRYEENRHEAVKKTSLKNERLLEEIQDKWDRDSDDLQRCLAEGKKLNAKISDIKSEKEKTEKMVGQCRKQLASSESNLEQMKDALLTKNRIEDGTDVAQVDSNDKKGFHLKPFLMEMKYDKSFRDTVLRRQGAAAAAGVAASILLQVLIPGVAKVFRVIFLK